MGTEVFPDVVLAGQNKACRQTSKAELGQCSPSFMGKYRSFSPRESIHIAFGRCVCVETYQIALI